MKDETVGEWVEGVADERGNSVNWNPPETWGGILFRSDSSKVSIEEGSEFVEDVLDYDISQNCKP